MKFLQFWKILPPLQFLLALSVVLLVRATEPANAMKMRFDLGAGENSEPSGLLHLQHDGIYFEYALRLQIGTLLGEPVTNTEMLWKIDPFASTVTVPSLGGRSPELATVNLDDLGPEAIDKIGFTEFKVVFRFSSKAFGQDVILVQDVGVLSSGNGLKWSYNVPGSPDWSRLYSPYRAEHHTFTDWFDRRAYLSEQEARDVLKSEPELMDAWIIPGRFTSYELHQWYRQATFRTKFNALEAFVDEVWNEIDEQNLLVKLDYSGWSFAHLASFGSDAERTASRSTGLGVIFEQGGRDQNFWRIAFEALSHEVADKLEILRASDFHSPEDYAAYLQIMTKAQRRLNERLIQSGRWSSPDPDPRQIERGYAARFDDAPLENSDERAAARSPKGSILFLIDTSGSMSGAKLAAAKQAARENMRASIESGSEVAILGFAGDCSSPISFSHPLSMDVASLTTFIDQISASGGTPLASALTHANEFLHDNKAQGSLSQAIVLLADGDNGCGNIDSVLGDLSHRNILYRHEAVGLGISSGSEAVQQLNAIADRSGGGYHYASSPKQLKRAFEDAFENMAIARMLGQFGQKATTAKTEQPSSLWDQLK